MEKNYVVMTDSSADLNPALEQELGVDIIPLSVNCGDRTVLAWVLGIGGLPCLPCLYQDFQDKPIKYFGKRCLFFAFDTHRDMRVLCQ